MASQSDDAVFEAKRAFLAALMKEAKAELDTALPSIPCAVIHRPRAEARARRKFMGTLQNNDACRAMFIQEATDVAV